MHTDVQWNVLVIVPWLHNLCHIFSKCLNCKNISLQCQLLPTFIPFSSARCDLCCTPPPCYLIFHNAVLWMPLLVLSILPSELLTPDCCAGHTQRLADHQQHRHHEGWSQGILVHPHCREPVLVQGWWGEAFTLIIMVKTKWSRQDKFYLWVIF